ncbi:MAG: metal-dependent transcriptional regulator [Ilumatobacter fluminis]|uniref:metal-dependent transcriptional regulator n=1 Tax=Ilumatobacter fluminis TaxID=467091 RepID=UPI0032F051D2
MTNTDERSDSPSAAAAMYLEAMFELAEDDLELVQARLADRLGISRPAVSEMVRRLVRDGYVVIDDRRLAFTDEGRAIAETAVRRHRLVERLLVDVLGLGWAEAHELAGEWQSVIDDRTEHAIIDVLGAPTTCPHGNPIPGAGYEQPGLVTLADLVVGDAARVHRVTEQLEVEPGMLVALERAGMVPGTTVRVTSISPDGSLAVKASKAVLALSVSTARGILVTPGDLSAISDQVAGRTQA